MKVIGWLWLAVVVVALGLVTHTPRMKTKVFWLAPPRDAAAVVAEVHPLADQPSRIVFKVDGHELALAPNDTLNSKHLDSLLTIGTPLTVQYAEQLTGMVYRSDTSDVMSQGYRLLAVYPRALN